MKVSFSSGSNRDVEEILNFYSSEAGPEVAMDFHTELRASIERIKQWPESAPEVRSHLRRALMSRFPFQIIYRLRSTDEIRILAVRHHKRRPKFSR